MPVCSCVAMPVFEGDGASTGGISLSGPSSRFTAQKLRGCVIEAAGKLSLKLRGGA